MRVLYLHMIGAFGGASRSLLEIVRAMPPQAVDPLFLLPKGSAATQFRTITEEIIEVRGMTQVDNTRYSYYRGFRWLVIIRELSYLPSTIIGLLKARKRWGSVDLIHVNEFTGVVPWLLARILFSAPVVVHVRSLVRQDPRSLRTYWMNKLFSKYADAIIAIDENVRSTLPAALPVSVIHNSFSMSNSAEDGLLNKVFHKLKSNSFKVGFVGNLLRVKGLFDLVEAAKILQSKRLNVEFIVVGGSAISNQSRFLQWTLKKLGLLQDVQGDVMKAVQKSQLTDQFHFVDFTYDIQSVYKKMNVLCFPSHYDAPGRPIFEAAFYGVPSIVAVQSPHSDTLINGATGLAIPPRNPAKLADAIQAMVLDSDGCRRMGEKARELAIKNFSVLENSQRLLDVYYRCLERR